MNNDYFKLKEILNHDITSIEMVKILILLSEIRLREYKLGTEYGSKIKLKIK